MKVKATVERNFRRAKVRPGKARRPRTRLLWPIVRHLVVLGLFGYTGYRAVSLIVHAAPLKVEHLPISGNVRLSDAEVQRLISGVRGHSILTADLDGLRAQVLESSWVADAALHRVLPSTIEIRVTERQPIGITRVGTELFLIDRTGALIDEFGPRYNEFDLPMIDGLVRTARGKAPVVDADRAALAARVMDGLAGTAVSRRVSQIDVANLRDVVVLLDDDDAELHVGREQFAARLQAYIDVADALHQQVADIDYVDLRYGERVYVKPRGRRGFARARGGG
jgi:cell division protein FtsQ